MHNAYANPDQVGFMDKGAAQVNLAPAQMKQHAYPVGGQQRQADRVEKKPVSKRPSGGMNA